MSIPKAKLIAEVPRYIIITEDEQSLEENDCLMYTRIFVTRSQAEGALKGAYEHLANQDIRSNCVPRIAKVKFVEILEDEDEE